KAMATEDPYALRARALDQALSPHELGRALFHLNQRRGFKSNRKAERKPGAKDGKVAPAAKALDEAMAAQGARTLGEFLHNRPERLGRRVRMRPDGDGYDFYPDRRHYEAEFETIWAAQSPHHPGLLTDDAKAALHRVIFFQRPLKDQVVGQCSFAGLNGVPADEQRLPKAHPLFQQRRLYEEVNQLRIARAGAADRPLSREDRDLLIARLQDKKAVSFDSLAKTIKLAEGESFNKQSENRKDLTGDEVRAVMQNKKLFGTRWVHFPLEEQWAILTRLIDEENPDALLAWLKAQYDLEDDAAEAIANAPLPEGHGRFGETATRLLLDELKSDVITYAEAAARAGFHHSDFRTGECFDQLPYYGEILAREIAPGKEDYGDKLERQWGKITNPTVHIGLNQLRRLVNALIARHGIPDEIYVELARDLKLNEKQKSEHKRRIKENTDAAKARGTLLESMGERDTGGNRLLLRLWQELDPKDALGRRCPYCGEQITADMLMNGSVDIDHIIPYSKSLDDSIGNKVVVHTHCNRDKGNKTPWERWGDTDRWPIIQDQVARLHRSRQWRFGPDAMDRVERDGGFVARQLTDTQYLSRMAAKYLGALYPEKGTRHVYALPGRMTAMLRRLWGLNDILPDHNYVENEHSNAPKNRLDHRHHAIDAAVAGATTKAMIARIAKAAARAEDANLDKLFVDLEQPWDGFREELRDRLMATTVSHKPDHGRKGKPAPSRDVTAGRLHNDTAYGFTGETSNSGLPVVVHRIPLTSLKPADLTDPERMSDHDLQDALCAATQGLSGKPFEQALIAFGKKPGPWQGIRRVRVREALGIIPIRDREGRAYKGYKGDANARFDVWRLPDGKWVTKWKDREGSEYSGIISMFDAHRRDAEPPRPHPAAKRILSLRQNDLLAIERNGGPVEIVRVVKFSGNGSIQLAQHNEAGALKARDADKVDPFKYINSSGSGLQKAKARQVRVDDLGRIFDPGPRE
ncbi:MAG: type II CRISPR RNA-guided endonuclease Cas9, partial [Novosphingobium sp.]|nr:type II CRISPR RNA-guided endonuclease Cas9 [Novosphingobium sp.]